MDHFVGLCMTLTFDLSVTLQFLPEILPLVSKYVSVKVVLKVCKKVKKGKSRAKKCVRMDFQPWEGGMVLLGQYSPYWLQTCLMLKCMSLK